MAPKETKKEVEPLSVVLKRAGKKALGGGIAGAMAMVLQVALLTWMRTVWMRTVVRSRAVSSRAVSYPFDGTPTRACVAVPTPIRACMTVPTDPCRWRCSCGCARS